MEMITNLNREDFFTKLPLGIKIYEGEYICENFVSFYSGPVVGSKFLLGYEHIRSDDRVS